MAFTDIAEQSTNMEGMLSFHMYLIINEKCNNVLITMIILLLHGLDVG